MCCLSCYLPLLIGDLAPKDDDDCLTHTFQVSLLRREYHALIIILTVIQPLCFGSRPKQHMCSFFHMVRDGF